MALILSLHFLRAPGLIQMFFSDPSSSEPQFQSRVKTKEKKMEGRKEKGEKGRGRRYLAPREAK